MLEINDIRILKEMRAYTNTDLDDDDAGTEEEEEEDDEFMTRHFDLLTSLCIAVKLNKYATISDLGIEHYEQPAYERPGSATGPNDIHMVMDNAPKTHSEFAKSRKARYVDRSYETDTPWERPGLS